MRRFAFALPLMLCCTTSAVSQSVEGFRDSFENGNFTHDPPWTGDTHRWTVVPFGDGFALRTDGESRQDTLVLYTDSRVSYGSWSFRFKHENISLSNFNGVRFYLIADRDDLRGPINGYYLQLGTNNLRRVELWRQDGLPSSRVRLGESESNLLEGTTNDVRLSVTRDPYGTWTVSMEEAVLFVVADDRYQVSRHFGMWLRHSAASGKSFFFDDFDVEGTAYVDITPPQPLAATTTNDGTSVTISWSEALDAQTITPSAFQIQQHGMPASVAYVEQDAAFLTRLSLSTPLEPGEYRIDFNTIADTSGNVVEAGTHLYLVHDPDLVPPLLLAAQYTLPNLLLLRFDEPLDSFSAMVPAHYHLEPAIGNPASATFAGESRAEVSLTFDRSFEDRTLYTIRVDGVADIHGNVLRGAAVSFFTGEADVPRPRDVVINEIYYDPPDNALEFVEIYNRSERIFNLRDFEIADDRMQPVRVTNEPAILPPGGYAVLARNSPALAAAFEGTASIQVAGLPVFNRGGDAAVLMANGITIDSLRYAPSWGGNLVSLERKDPEGPSTLRENWASATDPRGATPGAENSTFDPDRDPPAVIFADQPSDSVIVVFFDEPISDADVDREHFAADGQHPDVAELRASLREVHLHFPGGVSFRSLRVTGIRDLSGNRLEEQTVPVAQLARPGGLAINEIMFAPRNDRFDNRPDQPQYVELFNATDVPLTLRNLFWTGEVDKDGVADTLVLNTAHKSLPPGAYAVVIAEPQASADYRTQSMLAGAFPEVDFSDNGIVLLPLTRATLRMRRTSDVIRLHAPDRTLLEEVAYDVAWHHPSLLSTTGIALERVSLERPASARDNWMSSAAPSGGTPGRPNSIALPPGEEQRSPGLVIDPEVFSPDGTGHNDVVAIRYHLAAVSGSVRARIFDARGRHVRTLEESLVSGRSGMLIWDGLDDERRHLRIGIYVVLLESVDVENGITEAYRKPVVLARPLR